MQFSKVCAGLLLAASVSVIGPGCVNKPADSGMAATTMPATMPAMMPATMPAMTPATAPAVAVMPTPPKITATHVLTKDEPYFSAVPAAASAAPDGTLKSGTKVLMFSWTGLYAKVTAEDGTTGYVAIEGLDPISKK